MYGVKDIVNLFTDRFIGGKEEGSNLYSLMSVYSDELMLLKETNDRIMDWRNIDNAEGKALDLIGKDLRKPRGNNADAAYRIILKTKVAQNLANGTINGLINAIAYVLQIDKSEIKISEMWDVLKEPAALALEALPMQKIYDANLSASEFEVILKALVGAGIKLMLITTGRIQILECSGQGYGFKYMHRICGRFGTGRIDATSKPHILHIDGTGYSFAYAVPVTNRFSTAKIGGQQAPTQSVEADAQAYDFRFKQLVTALFGTERIAGGSGPIVTTEAASKSYGIEIKQRVTGRFRTGGRN